MIFKNCLTIMTNLNLNKKHILLLLLMLAWTFCAQAQRGILYSGKDMLSSSMVHSVYQDRQGFIWVCSENGIDRYDGYRFINYNITHGLLSDNVNCIFQDRNKDLYIGTSSGLNVMHNNHILPVGIKEENGVRPFAAYVTTFREGPDGKVYLGTSGRGIWCINPDKTVEKAFEDIQGIQFAQSFTFDRKGTLWVVTNNNGVFAIKGRKSRKYIIKESTNFADIITDKQDNVYIGFVNGGVYRTDPSRGGFTLIPSTANTSVTALKARRDGQIFVGTNGTGLLLLNPRTGELHPNHLYSNDIDMNKVKVYSILEDHTGNMWLGLLQKGVFMQPPHSPNIRHIGSSQGSTNPIGEQCVMAVYKQRNGTLWVATDQDGLYALDSEGRLMRHYTHDAASPKSVPGTIMSMTEDAQGRLWLGSFLNGCGWFDPATGEYHRSAISYGKSQSCIDLRMGRHNDLWIGTLGDGLKCLDLITGKVKEFRSGQPDYSSCLANDFVQQMEIDREGKYLFVGTTTGVSCLDIKSGRWDKVVSDCRLLDGTSIGALRYDKAVGLWVGNSNGLYNIVFKPGQPKNFTIKHYTSANGLGDNHVQSIEIDSRKQIWISTTKGICTLNPKTGKIKSFYSTDGLVPNEYVYGVSCSDSRGNMYFGGTQGLTCFNPNTVRQEPCKHDITLTQLLVGGVEIAPGDKSGWYEVCDTTVTDAQRFDLCSDDNSITLRFSTLTYSGLKNIRYRYSINGDDWIMLPMGQNELTLSRMLPGDYVFRIEALDNGTVAAQKEIKVVIHNPWYFTPVARLIYLLLAIAIVLYYLRQLKIRNNEKLKLQEHMHAEELNEQKLRSFINLSHEIRTPMTLILTPLLQLMKEETDSHRKATYDIIRRNAERILHLVNQIMDIRKIDKGQMSMQMCETEMVDFVTDVVDMFQLQAANKQIDITTRHDGIDKLPVWIDRMQFDKVLINLMSNAVKYSPAGGSIVVRITKAMSFTPLNSNSISNLPPAPADGTEAQNEGYVTVTVYNTGEKIPEKSLTKIFERFYQVSTASFQYKTGTGVGLDLARSIVLLHHGAIGAHNKENGVEFYVTLPLGKAHLKEEEIAPWKEEEHSTHVLRTEINALEQEQNNEEESVKTPVSSVKSKKAKVVIVEDDDEIRNYLMTELAKTYRVLCFSNGADALPAILREVPQLVISDVMMPVMDGYTLCSKIKSNVNTNHIPIILITAKTRDEDKMEGLETGADLYVTKPFNLDILQRNIANLIASRKVMQNKYKGKEDLNVESHEDETDNADKELINRIIEVINDNLFDSDLNIDMICEKVGISRVHLNRKMKEMTNQTPHAFIKNLRIKAAAKMLREKDLSISEVMWKCGFNSPTTFSTMFKKMYGQSPRDYKKEAEEEE